MIRINLLPPEIIERRKYERFYPYVWAITIVLLVMVVLTWGVLQFISSSLASELQGIEQSAANLRQQAEGLAVFELKEQELAQRQATVSQAIAGRIDMGRLAEEVSLVLPDEVWTTLIDMSEGDGFSATMYAPKPIGQAVDEGYKSVATTLVRLASLSTLNNVWLTTAETWDFTEYQGSEKSEVGVPTLRFEVTASIAKQAGQ